jgi:hypothetical protein
VLGARAGYAGLLGMNAQGLDAAKTIAFAAGFGAQFGLDAQQACLATRNPIGNGNYSVTALASERKQYRKHPAFYRKSRRKTASD